MLKLLSITLITALTASTALAETFNITSGSTTNAGNTVDGSDTVNITGTLQTNNTNGHGISTTGGLNTVNLESNAKIITTAADAYGIFNVGDQNETTISGEIDVSGSAARGVYNSGDNNITSISGSIKSSQNGKHAIDNTGDNNTTTMSGSVSTTRDNATAIDNVGDDNKTISSGTVTTAGDASHGIGNTGDDNVTTMSGNISTSGDSSSGINNYGGGNSTTVSGTITTSGEDADGVWSGHGTGTSNTVSVTGSITTTGTGSSGVEFYGATNSATISGTINSSGTDSTALRNQNGNGNSFQLNEGAIIIGDILAIGGSTVTNGKLIFNLGEGTSYAYSVSGNGSGTGVGQWTFSDLDGRTQGVSTTGSGCNLSIANANTSTCNLVTAVTPGNIEAHNELQYASNRSFINSLNFGLTKDRSSGKGVWLEAYGDKADRDASKTNATAFALDTNSSGYTIGKPLKFGESINLDLIFNGSSTDLDIGTTKDQKIASKSYNLGLVLNNLSSSDNWNVNAFGFVGNNSYDGKRKVMNNQVSTGSETVTASYSGRELLLGFNAGYNNAITDNLSFIANLNANLSYETIGAYSESKYYSWDKRDLTQTAGGLKVGFNYIKNSFSTFATVGTDFNSLQDGNKATYKNNGTAASYTDTEDGDTFGTASLGVSYIAKNGLAFNVGVEGFSSNKGLTGNLAKIALTKNMNGYIFKKNKTVKQSNSKKNDLTYKSIYTGLGFGLANAKQPGYKFGSTNIVGILGYDINNYFAIEGELSIPVSRDTIKVSNTNVELGVEHMAAYAKFTLPLSSSIKPYARLGVSKGESSVTVGSTTVSLNDTALAYGVGAEWIITDRISQRLDYSQAKYGNTDGNIASLSTVFRF